MKKLLGNLVTDLDSSIQDCQFNYYGNKLALCDCEGFIEIQNIEDFQNENQNQDQGVQREKIQAHKGPIWQLSWADPSCGNLLASCSYDKTIQIWEEENCKLINRHTMDKYDCSVNCICWGPSELGIMLVAGLSSGDIVLIKYSPNDNQWVQHKLEAHKSSVNAVKFFPYVADKKNQDAPAAPLRFASCSCDNTVLEWISQGNFEDWKSTEIGTHDEWVRDLDIYFNTDFICEPSNVSYDRVVSGGEDNKVRVWKKLGPDADWKMESEIDRQAPVWRVEFNTMGNLLSVCSGDNLTSLYKENVPGSGGWELQ